MPKEIVYDQTTYNDITERGRLSELGRLKCLNENEANKNSKYLIIDSELVFKSFAALDEKDLDNILKVYTPKGANAWNKIESTTQHIGFGNILTLRFYKLPEPPDFW